MKTYVKCFVFVCLTSMLLVGCTSPKIENACDPFPELPKHALGITTDFKEISKPVYNQSDASISFTIDLTDLGRKYIATQLFVQDYAVSVEIIDMDTQESYGYVEGLSWKCDEGKKSFDVVFELDETNKKTVDRKVTEDDGSRIRYRIQIYSETKDTMVFSENGSLEAK